MKDAKGHGSNSRGGSYHNIDKNARGAGKHIGHAGEPFHIQKSNGPKSNWYSAVGQRSGTVMSGKGLGEISSRLADHAAKAELARGNPKADAAPVHAGANGPQRNFPITLIGDPGHAEAQKKLVNNLLRRR